MIEEKEIICIVCPTGCVIKSCKNDNDSSIPDTWHISGNKCKRGADYALAECIDPMRVLTTTVKVLDGQPCMAPVKSDKPLPIGKLFECMKVISNSRISVPVKVGDIIIGNILDTGANIIVTSNIHRRNTDA